MGADEMPSGTYERTEEIKKKIGKILVCLSEAIGKPILLEF
jgi:hypothetical protein